MNVQEHKEKEFFYDLEKRSKGFVTKDNPFSKQPTGNLIVVCTYNHLGTMFTLYKEYELHILHNGEIEQGLSRNKLQRAYISDSKLQFLVTGYWESEDAKFELLHDLMNLNDLVKETIRTEFPAYYRGIIKRRKYAGRGSAL